MHRCLDRVFLPSPTGGSSRPRCRVVGIIEREAFMICCAPRGGPLFPIPSVVQQTNLKSDR